MAWHTERERFENDGVHKKLYSSHQIIGASEIGLLPAAPPSTRCKKGIYITAREIKDLPAMQMNAKIAENHTLLCLTHAMTDERYF